MALAGCSSATSRADRGLTLKEDLPAPRHARAVEQRPVSDTHPYQINDILIYPVKWNKVEDVAPTVQQLFQARYGPGVVVIPHVATNKLLIYLPPPQERERAGAAGTPSALRTPSPAGRPTTTTRGRGTVSRGRTSRATTR